MQKAPTRRITSQEVQAHPSHHFNVTANTTTTSSSSVLLRQQSIEPVLHSLPQPQLPSIYFHHPTLQRAIKLAERKEFTRLLKAEELCMDKIENDQGNPIDDNIKSNATSESNCSEEKSEKGNTDKLQSLIHRLSRKSTIPAAKKQKLLASLSAQQQQHKQEENHYSSNNQSSNSYERNDANKDHLQKRKTKRRKVSRLALLIQAQRNVAEWFQSSRVANSSSSTTTSLQSHRTPVHNVFDSSSTNKTKKSHSPFTFSYTFGTLEDRLCAAFIATFARYTLKGEDGTHRVHHRRLIRNLSVLEDDSSQICTCNVDVKPIQSISLPTRYNANGNQESSTSNNNISSWRDLLTTSSISQALVPFFKGTGLKQIEMFASHRSIAVRFANETNEECSYSGLFTSEQLEKGFDNKYVAFHASKAAMLEGSFLESTNTSQQQKHHDFECKEKNEVLEIKEKNNSANEEIEEPIGKAEIDKGKYNKSALLEPVVLSPFHAKKSQEQRDALSSSSSSLTMKANINSLNLENKLEHNGNRTSANELVRLAPFGVSLLIAASMSLQRIPITLQSPEASLAIDDKSIQAERDIENTNTEQKDNTNSISNNSDVNAVKNNVNNVNPVKTGHVMDSDYNTVTWKDVFGAPYTIDVSCVEELGLHHLLPTNVKATVNQVCKEINLQKMSTNKLNENDDKTTHANETEQIQKGNNDIHKECEHKSELITSEKEVANKPTLLANTKPRSTSAFLSIQSPINVTRMIYWKVAMPSLSWLVERYKLRRANCYHRKNYYINYNDNDNEIKCRSETSQEIDVSVKYEQLKQRTSSSETITEENDCSNKEEVFDDDNNDLPRICEVCNTLCLHMSFFKEHCQTNAHLAHLQFAIEHHISCDQFNLINGNTSLKFNDNNKNKKNDNSYNLKKKSNYSDCVTSLLHKGTRVNTGNNFVNSSDQGENKSNIVCSSATINPQSTSYAWDDLVSKSGNIDHNNNLFEQNDISEFEMNGEKGSKVEFRSELKPCRLSHLSFLNALQWNNNSNNSESSVTPLAVAGGLTSSFANNEVELPPMALQKSTQHRPYLQSHKTEEKEEDDEGIEKEDDNVIEHSRWANNVLANATASTSSSS